jgi:hypothetical protein
VFIGCNKEKEDILVDITLTTELDPVEKGSFSVEQRDSRPVILGKQKENPYSVKNMQIALDSLLSYATVVGDGELRSADISIQALENVSISTTDLYVRFLPQDTTGYEALQQDTTLELFNYPLDYEIVQTGDYLFDPTLGDNEYTWRYAVVPPSYQPPQGVIYEVLEELFIIEHSEGYSEEVLLETETATRSVGISKGFIDSNLREALIATSFVLTGNGDEIRKNEVSNTRSTITTCKRKCILWGTVCWTSCDTQYYPEGYIKVNTPSGNVGLKGVKVRTSRWFHSISMRTNASGYYCSSSDYYDDILIGNSAHYEIIFEGLRDSSSWTLSRSLFGALCLWTNSYGAGYHTPAGHSVTFHTNSDSWGKAVLSNAIYDYITYAKSEGISLLPKYIDIANKESNNLESSAPLLTQHLNLSLVYDSPLWGTGAVFLGYAALGWALPDLILRYTNSLDKYNDITAIVWHELTHVSQLERMKKEKGYFWASDYWSHIVLQEASNDMNNGVTYGTKGNANWQIIALTEGWAYYREWRMAIDHLGWRDAMNISSDNSGRERYFTTLQFPYSYGAMYDSLVIAGCSYQNIEKSLCTYNLIEFRNTLIAKYPSKKDRITTIIKQYE